MASSYMCSACSRAIRRSSTPRLQPSNKLSLRQAHRTFSAATPTFYHVSHTRSADVRPEAIKKPHPSVASGVTGLAQKLREKAPLMTETYVAYGATRDLIKECTKPGEYKIPQALLKGGEIPVDDNGVHLGEAEGWWYDTLGLKPTFSNWAQITFIHMYMLQVRFRMFPQTHAPVWIQHLTNHAFYAAEDRLVVWHKFNANSLRQKYLKDMFSQWRAVLLSYDEGLVKGDAMLAAAIWRNLLGAREDVDFEKLAQIVGYMRRELKRLDNATDDDVANGQWKFRGSPGDEAGLVKSPSRLMATETVKA
ncbi:ubiquinol-cytochrome C chaperone-domain-containing protein [Bipolaris maydis]|nr:ubiquinol-cytochrome C chaperone-domain-containing protein [Bipolaris maydis]KAJ5063650.1 ubiquinol-cytochrome C chaperone-domain-containing protein [Bipolaris maydis]KAJ6199910.1 ubiquinol-cytochrome C chaperone-domain-containing protein [Bipolaris maydis]